MDLVSLHPYREGSAIIIGFALGLLVGGVAANLPLGLCLGVGIGAVIDGIMRIRAARQISI